MLKLTIAGTVLFAAAAGGAGVIAAAPGSAQVRAGNSHDYRKSVSRSHNLATRQLHRNRNWNANEEDSINRIRLPFNSTNNVTPTVNVSPVVAPAVAPAVVPTV